MQQQLAAAVLPPHWCHLCESPLYSLLLSLSPLLLWMSEQVRACGGRWVDWLQLLWSGDQWSESERSSAIEAGLWSPENGNFGQAGGPVLWCIITIKGMDNGGKVLFLSPLPLRAFGLTNRTNCQYCSTVAVDVAEGCSILEFTEISAVLCRYGWCSVVMTVLHGTWLF